MRYHIKISFTCNFTAVDSIVASIPVNRWYFRNELML